MTEKTSISDLIFTVSNVVSTSKCTKLIFVSERDMYVDADPDVVVGDKTFSGVRNCGWVRKAQPRWAMSLWRKLWSHIPEYKGLRPVTVHSEFVFLRYEAGQGLGWHKDPQVSLPGGERSWLTMYLYLNSNFEGGTTNFLEASIKPVQGTALFYPHDIPHQEKVVVRGTKYVLQSAVLYEDPAGTTDETLPLG